MPKKLLLLIISLLAITILSVFIVVVLPERAFQKDELVEIPTTLSEPLITFVDPIRGNKDAKITIVEFGDFACALCKSIEPALQAVISEAPNKRRLIWKDAPNVNEHAETFTASMAARCAQDQGKFWEYHDRLMLPGTSLNAENLVNIAVQLELNEASFQSCMASDVTRPIVQHTLEEAFALDISGTPTIFLNGVEYTGPLTIEGINSAIDSL